MGKKLKSSKKPSHPPLLAVIKGTINTRKPKLTSKKGIDEELSDEEAIIEEEYEFIGDSVKNPRKNTKKPPRSTKNISNTYDESIDPDVSDLEDNVLSLFPETTLNLAQLISTSLLQENDQQNPQAPPLPSHLLELYTQVGVYLKSFKSGKLPKAFKAFTRLAEWEHVLQIMAPLEWSPNAMEHSIKVLSSNLNSQRAEIFYRKYLLVAARMDILKNKKLNYHYYHAIKKAIFKPSAWMKGILFPLIEEGCTLKEAAIIGSILSKISIPMTYVAASLLHICQLNNWHPTTNYFISILINKQYSLPQEVIDVLCNFFSGFIDDDRVLPLVWHKSFLAFVQRYKIALNSTHKNALLALLKKHTHPHIGPLIKNEIIYLDPFKMLQEAS